MKSLKIFSHYVFLNRYTEKKKKGEIKSFNVCSLPASKQIQLREKWRKAQQKHRKRKSEMDAIMNITPPSLEVSLSEEDAVAPTNVTTPPEPYVTSQPSTKLSPVRLSEHEQL